MNDYRLESPPILRDFLSYHETIKAHSQKTVDEYFLDLRNFFRYLKQSHDPSLRDLPLNEISIMDVDLDFVKNVTLHLLVRLQRQSKKPEINRKPEMQWCGRVFRSFRVRKTPFLRRKQAGNLPCGRR